MRTAGHIVKRIAQSANISPITGQRTCVCAKQATKEEKPIHLGQKLHLGKSFRLGKKVLTGKIPSWKILTGKINAGKNPTGKIHDRETFNGENFYNFHKISMLCRIESE